MKKTGFTKFFGKHCTDFNPSPMHGKYADTKLDYVLYVKIYNIGR